MWHPKFGMHRYKNWAFSGNGGAHAYPQTYNLYILATSCCLHVKINRLYKGNFYLGIANAYRKANSCRENASRMGRR